MLQAQAFTRLPFSTPYGFNTLRLAHVLDSLVRVSRRVVRNRYVYNQVIELKPYHPPTPGRTSHRGEPPLPSRTTQSSCLLDLLLAITDLHTYIKTEARSSRY